MEVCFPWVFKWKCDGLKCDPLERRIFHIVVAMLPMALAKATVWNEGLTLGEYASRHSKHETKVRPLCLAMQVFGMLLTQSSLVG